MRVNFKIYLFNYGILFNYLITIPNLYFKDSTNVNFGVVGFWGYGVIGFRNRKPYFSHLPSSFLLLTTYFLLLTSYFLLLTSYSLLLTPYFLLLTPYLPPPQPSQPPQAAARHQAVHRRLPASTAGVSGCRS